MLRIKSMLGHVKAFRSFKWESANSQAKCQKETSTGIFDKCSPPVYGSLNAWLRNPFSIFSINNAINPNSLLTMQFDDLLRRNQPAATNCRFSKCCSWRFCWCWNGIPSFRIQLFTFALVFVLRNFSLQVYCTGFFFCPFKLHLLHNWVCSENVEEQIIVVCQETVPRCQNK